VVLRASEPANAYMRSLTEMSRVVIEACYASAAQITETIAAAARDERLG
jgi:hypothetical protein